MEPRRINAFADLNLDNSLKVAIARDLKNDCESRYPQTFGG